ncbi:hypothetical protein DFH09DRAFT_1335503 [Mycena vulgaris]|nr:hypothetical protein DFH09DRAFT_1335503 [Mycena vulgaris]
MSPPTIRSHPPMKSKYVSGPSAYELQAQRHQDRKDKARLRMARYAREELKARSAEEQTLAAERSRAYQATYRQKNRRDLKLWEALRRGEVYKAKYGPVAHAEYVKARHARIRRQQQARKAKEAYHSADEDGGDDAAVGSRKGVVAGGCAGTLQSL